MTGYFSRLMEQTEMRVGPDVGSVPKTLGQPRKNEVGKTAPIDLDTFKLVGPQENVAPTPETSDSASAQSISSVDNPVEQEPGARASQVTEQPEERNRLYEQNESPEEREFVVWDSAATSPQREMAAEGSKEVGVMAKTGAGSDTGEIIENVAPQENERTVSGDRSPKQTLIGRPDQAPGNRTEAWRGAVREIREWVAETTTEDVAKVENSVRSKPELAQPDPLLPERERVAAYYPNRASPTRPEEPQTQDLHLAVGTISVTVEEPRPETEVSGSSYQTQKTPNAGNDERSRLGRHYIRTW